ncbi:ribonuclease R [Enterococcus ratti]|uniref:ribonuclease R n=1 Tax=Enterococcus ratti TaxID=150033 RepID=UPI0035151B73
MTKKTLKEKIIFFIENECKKSFSMEEIAQGLGLQKSKDFKLLVQTIAQMEREQRVIFTKKGKVKLPLKPILIEGIFRANERGFGFVTIDSEEDDVYVPKEATGYAMDGDTVAIDIVKTADAAMDRGAEGKVVEIRKRAITQLVGEFVAYTKEEINETDLYGVVLPKEKKLNQFKVYAAAEGIRPVDGSIVMIELTHYPEKNYTNSLEGIIKQVIGHKNDPGMDILSIIVSNGIPTKFSDDVLLEADDIPDAISEKDLVDRKDLREQLIVTIDGEDAKDLDDAVTVKKLANGNYFLGVHIADVSYYVTQGSQLDKEAYERGTSVYLTDRVIPMIPQRLSNGICSLNPQVPRLTMSCEMEIDANGRVVTHDIFSSVIQTTERMTYTAVNQILEEQDEIVMERYEQLVPMLQEMQELHYILETMRIRRGAVSFEDREAKILVEPDGRPMDIQLRDRGIGERLIESFMLVANETVAQHFNQQHFPFIYRIHEQPKEEKMQRFFGFASALGIVVRGTKGTITPKDLQKVIETVENRPESAVINTMLLRSMQQARYSEDNFGHYGLAADYYTHFTSPIRRYPDLIVHRLIRSYRQDASEENQTYWEKKLPEIADHSSKMERRAVEAEREVDAMKKAEYMMDKVGEEFEGIISSVVKFGLFVELSNTIEGLVHINDLKQDYFHFIENHLALVGERTGVTFKIGQKVRVKVIKADPIERAIDFELVEAEEVLPFERPKASKKGKHSNRQQKRQAKNRLQRNNKKNQPFNERKKGKKAANKKGKKPFYKGIKKKK